MLWLRFPAKITWLFTEEFSGKLLSIFLFDLFLWIQSNPLDRGEEKLILWAHKSFRMSWFEILFAFQQRAFSIGQLLSNFEPKDLLQEKAVSRSKLEVIIFDPFKKPQWIVRKRKSRIWN